MNQGRNSVERVHVIDAVRGFCLLLIFLNHITLGYLQTFSPVHIMFSDSAEVFIFLAGVSCFLAYGPKLDQHFEAANIAKIWRRARLLFFVNWLIIAASIVILEASNYLAPPPNPDILPSHLVAVHGIDTYLWHVLSLQESIGYSVVLRLYVFLMLLAPLYVWLAAKRFWYPVVPAGLMWLLSGHFGWVESNSLSATPLALTILPWGLIFAAGISFGAAGRQGVTLIRKPGLVLLSTAVVLSGPICAIVLLRITPDALMWAETRNEFFWTGASKTFQSPLRVLYMMSLVYLVAILREAPLIRLFHQSTADGVLCRLGRSSLEVFCSGAIMALIADNLLWFLFSNNLMTEGSLAAILVELGLISIAISVMIRIADTRSLRFAAIWPGIRNLSGHWKPGQAYAK